MRGIAPRARGTRDGDGAGRSRAGGLPPAPRLRGCADSREAPRAVYRAAPAPRPSLADVQGVAQVLCQTPGRDSYAPLSLGFDSPPPGKAPALRSAAGPPASRCVPCTPCTPCTRRLRGHSTQAPARRPLRAAHRDRVRALAPGPEPTLHFQMCTQWFLRKAESHLRGLGCAGGLGTCPAVQRRLGRPVLSPRAAQGRAPPPQFQPPRAEATSCGGRHFAGDAGSHRGGCSSTRWPSSQACLPET